MPPLRLLFALLALVLAVPATAEAKKGELRPVSGPLKAKIGIADQKAAFFSDPRFRALGLKVARRSVAWDALAYDWQVRDIDEWLLAARRAGVRPLITFARSRIASRRHLKPTGAQIASAFRAFRARYPWVTDFVASNESNHFGEPTGRNPKLAAQHYQAMRRVCPSCKIAAATLLDQPNLVSWAKAFIRYAKEKPKYWALHNYVSANRFEDTRTRQLLLAIPGEIWLTEVGGLVKRRTPDRPGKAKLTEGVNHAAKVTRYIFDRLVRISPRISRIYLYHWNAEGPLSTWDSGLVGADGTPRPAFDVFRSVLKTIRSGKAPAGAPPAPAAGKKDTPAKKKPGAGIVVEGEIPG